MAFIEAESRVPVSIGKVFIGLLNTPASGEDPAEKSARYEVQVVYSNGDIVVKQGNLVPHLSQVYITGLQALLNDVITQAEEGFLPEII